MRLRRLLHVLIGVLALLAGTTGCGLLATPAVTVPYADNAGPIDPVAQRFPPAADVTMRTCTGSGGFWTASGTVRNPTSRSYDYTIDVEFDDSRGVELDQASAVVANPLRAGAQSSWKAHGNGTLPAAKGCRIVRVVRVTP